MAKKVPGKEEFYETLRYFSVKLDVDGVDVRLSTKVTAEDLVQGGYDAVVLATGVLPRELDIEGIDHPNVLSYVDVLKGGASVGKKVAVVGAGGIGFDVAEYLTHASNSSSNSDTLANKGGGGAPGKYGVDQAPPPGDVPNFMEKWGVDMKHESRGGLVKKGPWETPREVQLLQRKTSKHGATLGKTTGWIHRAGLANTGVEMIGGVNYDKVDENGNLHITIKRKVKKSQGDKSTSDGSGNEERSKYTTESKVLEVDNIILCAGQVSLDELEAPLKAAGTTVFKIGGAQYAGELDANRAIDQGTRLALQVEDAKGGDVFERPIGFAPKLMEKMRSFK